MERNQRIQHGRHGNEGEKPRGDAADSIAKVEKTDGETAQDDGEVEPGEEGTLIGEEDLGLDAGGEGNAFALIETTG